MIRRGASRGAMIVGATVLPLLLAASTSALARRVPFWPDDVLAQIQARVDGAAVLEAVRVLGRHHRVQGSPGYRAAAEWLAGELRAAGLAEVEVLALPADGKTTYAHFPSYLGWEPGEARLEEIAPAPRVLAEFPALAVALADYSQDADVTAELVDVGAGAAAADYQGKEVRGRLVLADGDPAVVHKQAVEQRGAAGILSDYPNQKTAWSGLDPDLVRWGHLDPYQTANRFAFMLSSGQAAALRAELVRGPVKLRAHVRARMVAASFDVVSATIPGTDRTAGEIVLTAHLCHQRAGANDNASGSAALLGVARALRAAGLPPPRRTIRFLWLPEIAGSQAWLARNPEIAARLRAGVHLDMVGGRPDVTHASLHVSRTASALPHVANEIARAFVDEVARASTSFAEGGTGDGMVSPSGSRDALVADMRPLEQGSDHDVFQAWGVPMVYFHDWPDVTIHTSKDIPENLDATKLGRVTYMAAGIAWTLAALPDAAAARLPALERAAIEERRGRARRTAVADGWSAADARLADREAVAAGAAGLASIAALWPSTAAAVARETRRLPRTGGGAGGPDRRIPVRTTAVRGPLEVYYYDHLARVLPAVKPPALAERGVLAYEALLLVDGRRTVSDIRDILTGRIEPVPVADVAAWIDHLARAGVVRYLRQD